MAGSVNKVILVGNLGKDPEVRHLENGASVCNFPLATSEIYKDRNGEKVSQTEWHNVVLWRGLAEVAEKYLKKGSKIYVEGKLRTRSWQDQEGNMRYTTEIVGDNLTMLDNKTNDDKKEEVPAYSSPVNNEKANNSGEDEEDLPF